MAQWLMGVCNLLQWRNRSGFSPDSLTFDCDKDELAFTVFKEHLLLEPIPPNAKKFLNSSGEKFSEPRMDSDDFGLVRIGPRGCRRWNVLKGWVPRLGASPLMKGVSQ